MNALVIVSKVKRLWWILPVLLLLVGVAGSKAWALPGTPSALENERQSQIELVCPTYKIRENQEFYVGVRFDIPAGSHIGWVNAGENGIPTSVDWQLPDGFQVLQTLWPPPRLLNFMGEKVWAYEGKVLIIGRFQAPPKLTSGRQIKIGAKVNWLDCSGQGCLPGSKTSAVKLEVVPSSEQVVSSDKAQIFAEELARLIPSASLISSAWTEPGWFHLQLKWKPESSVQKGSNWTFCPFSGPELNLDKDSESRWTDSETLCLDIPLRTYESPEEEKKAQAQLTKAEGLLVENGSGRYVYLNLNVDHQVGSAFRDQSSATTQGAASAEAPVPFNWYNFIVYTLFAFAGGIILNFMPCVFPVLSLKVFNFIEQAGNSENRRAHSIKAALWFSLGILLSFWLVAAIIITLKMGGQEMGWGFQMQYPAFVAFLTLLFFLIALNLWGVFEFGLGFTRLGNLEKSEPKAVNSILSGALTVIAAAPCTAPFMGSALGFSFSAPIYVSAVIFTALALGMSLPYAILASWPSLLDYLPGPGRWMESLKQLLAFPLAFTCIYFLWIFAEQTGRSGAALLAASLVWAALSAWIYGRFSVSSPRTAWSFTAVAALLALLTAYGACLQTDAAAATDASGSRGEAAAVWSEQAVSAALARKQPVFIDFGADWCLTCQFNEKTVLHSREVRSLFDEKGVLFLKADWTNRNDEITKALRRYGRTGVPLYVYYNPDKQDEPVILPEILTVNILKTHIK
ncbi:MAG: thioredoxin family protein [Candidatus Bruticola sp.]